MRNIAIVSAVAALAVATPALAANSGAYVGVGVTHDNLGGSADLENNENGNDIDGIGGTVFAGYDFALSENVFAGVEANFDLASAKAGPKGNSFELDHAFGVSARLGYNLNSSTALYGRVGYQNGRVTDVSTTTVDDGTTTTTTVKTTKTSYDGLRLGAGLETALTEQLSLRFEYNRTHYYFSDAANKKLAADLEKTKAKGGYNNNQFSIGVAYGF